MSINACMIYFVAGGTLAEVPVVSPVALASAADALASVGADFCAARGDTLKSIFDRRALVAVTGIP